MIDLANAIIVTGSLVGVFAACLVVLFHQKAPLVRGLVGVFALMVFLELADLFVFDHFEAVASALPRGALEEVLRAALFATLLSQVSTVRAAVFAAVFIAVIESLPAITPIFFASATAIYVAPQPATLSELGPGSEVLVGGIQNALLPATMILLRVGLHIALGVVSIAAWRQSKWGMLGLCACLHGAYNLSVTLATSGADSLAATIVWSVPFMLPLYAAAFVLARQLGVGFGRTVRGSV